MAKTIENAELIAKASKGYISDYYTSSAVHGKKSDDLKPEIDLNSLKLLMYDDTFNSEVNTLVDAVTKKDFKIIDWDDLLKREISREKKLIKKFNYLKLTKKVLMNLIVYRNAFIELDYKGDRVDNLHLLETPEMSININPHGEVKGFTQEPIGVNNAEPVTWSTNECVHVSTTHLGTNPWGFTDTRAIENIVSTKARMETYIDKLFKDNKFRNLWNIVKPSGTQQVKNFIDSIRQGKDYPEKDVVIEGEVTQKQLQTMDNFEPWLNMYREYKDSIRKFLRLPAIMSGGEGSKSSAEFQIRAGLENTVRGWQKIIEDAYSIDIFPLLGWDSSRLKYFLNDVPNEEKFISMAVQLKGLGYDNDSVNRFLHNKNVEMPDGMKMVEPEETEDSNNILDQSLQNKNAPSRKSSDKSLEITNNDEDVTTREDQIVGKAKPSTLEAYGQYPYVIS